MKKYILSALTMLMTVSTVTFAAEDKNIVQNTESTSFGRAYKTALSRKLGVNNLKVGKIKQENATAVVIQFDGDINMRQARRILVDSVETMQNVINTNPELRAPGADIDINNITLVIDTYDDSKKKDQQYGVSSIILSNGVVYFMGISHHTGKEVLLHKQPFGNAVIMNRSQGGY